MNAKQIGWVALAVVSGAMLVSCGGAKTATETTVAAAAPVAAPAPQAAADQGFVASGPIVVENQVELQAQRDGIVAQIVADTGVHVKKGQLLAKLDDRQIAADRDAADARYKSIDADVKNWEAEAQVAQADYDRAQKMMDAQLITKEQLEHARYKLVASQFEVQREKENARNAQETARSLSLELDKTRIVAPFDGVVARRYIHIGEKVTKDDKLFWVSGTGPMRVRFTLPEKYLGSLKRGDEVTVISPAAPETRHAAKVITISPVVDPASGTIEVQAQLVGAAGDLLPGMTANVQLK